MTVMASRITGQSSVWPTVRLDWQQRNITGLRYCHFVSGFSHKGTVMRKMYPFYDVIINVDGFVVTTLCDVGTKSESYTKTEMSSLDTRCCHFNNIQCNRWRKRRQNGDISVSVCMAFWSGCGVQMLWHVYEVMLWPVWWETAVYWWVSCTCPLLHLCLYKLFHVKNVLDRRRLYCPACRTSLIATRFWVVVICPISKCLTVLEFSFILFDLCLFITIFNFILNYVPIVTFWIFTYHKIWILFIIFCFIWNYWIIYFLTCLEVFWSVVS